MNIKTAKILVVEDNPIVAEDLRMKLTKLGYQVTDTAMSGEQALESIKTTLPDIAFMDINLGKGIDGITTATLFKERYNLSVIYLTAHADDATLTRAKTTEPYGYIIKPFDDNELKSVIEVAVHKQKVEKKLMEKHTWLETTLNSIGDGVITTDTRGNVTFLNPVAEEKTGWKSLEAKGKPIEDIFHIRNEHSGHRVENPVNQVLSTGEQSSLVNNTLLISKDGNKLPIKDSGSPIKTETGKTLGTVLVFQDDSKERKTRKKLLAQKKEAELYLNLAEVLFIGLDKEGCIIMTNEKARKILEISNENVIGLNWFENFVPEENRYDAEKVFNTISSGKLSPYEYYEAPILTKSQQRRQIAWHNSYIEDENNTIIGILSSGEDITEKLQLRKKLQHAQKMESIGNLAGGIAHDFNNILTAILGFTELSLGIVDEGSELEDNLQEVRAAGMRAKDIVSQILYFSRQSEEKVEPTCVETIARETANLFKSLIPANIRIVEEYSGNGHIMGSPSQLHQIFMNLCTNATQSMEKTGGELRISVQEVNIDKHLWQPDLALQKGKYVKVIVSDDGIGIAEKDLDSIFEPYFTTKDIGEGTGMGLAMVHGIVESYGGNITVKSNLGEGAKFSLFFPAVDTQPEHTINEETDLIHSQKQILVVDDELPICKYVKRTLEAIGYTVTTYQNPTEALIMFSSSPEDFDALITDVSMPEMTGDVLARKVLAIRPDLPIIITSGYSKILHEKEFAEIDVQAVALKPLSTEELEKIVHGAISGMTTKKG
jgi:PAS domain S-box-containing protein